ncbi:predicted protein [Histoplasma capsulatum H143]|uniref:Uncharacterized protein n=1 Tax=Ajellomyces capsulatus (strain H143) TaxID=544712 RepID=C6HPC0_AJECH|nr:predicted protein [Histoplasma capsulatum H143]
MAKEAGPTVHIHGWAEGLSAGKDHFSHTLFPGEWMVFDKGFKIQFLQGSSTGFEPGVVKGTSSIANAKSCLLNEYMEEQRSSVGSGWDKIVVKFVNGAVVD